MNLFKKSMASVALVTLLSSVFTTGVSAYTGKEVEAANALASKGIINTQTDVVNYNLGQNVLRQEIAKVAANTAGIEAKTVCNNSFTDVSATTPNTWACGYAEALLDAGKVSANATFRPEDFISKSESVKMMLEAAGYTNVYTNASNWQEEVVAFAANEGVIGTFTDYNANATRGFVFEVAAMAIEATEEDVVDEDDLLNDILDGIIGWDDEDGEDDEDKDDEDTTPVVSGDNVLEVSLSPETPASGNVAAGTARTTMLAFDVTAGSDDVTLKDATFEFTGLGDRTDIEKLAIYVMNDKITKGDSKKFDSDNESELTFENDTVVKAGETKTLMVTATIKSSAADENQSLQISLVDLDASSTVEGDSLVGSTLVPVKVSNVASLTISSDKASDNVTVGEEVKLAGFKLEETADKEDVVVKSITFDVDGSVDAEEDISDLVLFADNTEIASGLMVNNDDEIIVNLDYTVESDEKVEFELRGVVTGSVNDTIEVTFASDAIYAVGANTGISIDLDTSSVTLSDVLNIEGSEINVSFDKSDIDEAKPNAEDVLAGTLKISSVSDYTIKTVTITVEDTSSNNNIEDLLTKIELDGSSADKEANLDSDKATYTFDDIDLNANEEYSFDVNFDVVDNTAVNGSKLKFSVAITEVEDEENDKSYDVGATGSNLDIADVLSSTALETKTIDLESASFELVSTEVNDTELVLGNGIQTVLYKGKISVGDSDDVTLEDIDFKAAVANSLSNSKDFDDIIDTATLKIGSTEFDGDIESNKIEFNSINAVVAAGSDNIEVLVSAVLKDNDSIENNDRLAIMVDTASLELSDSEDEELATVVTTDANTKLTETVLLSKGTFDITVVSNGDNKNEVVNTVLAGSKNVNLAEVELQTEKEAADVNELVFSIAGGSSVGLTAAEGVLATAESTLATTKSTLAIAEADLVTKKADETTKLADTAAKLAAITEAGVVTAAAAVVTAETSVTAAQTQYATAYNLPQGTFDEITARTAALSAANTAISNANTALGTANTNLGTAITSAITASDASAVAYNTAKIASDAATSDVATAQTAVNNAQTAVNNAQVVVDAAKADVATEAGLAWSADFSDTLKNVRLKNGSTVLADGAKVTFSSSTSKTLITFEDFILNESDSTIEALLVADLEKVTDDDSTTSAALGDVVVKFESIDVEGDNSQEVLTGTQTAGASETVSVVPATVIVSKNSLLADGDSSAVIAVTIDEGSNDFGDTDITLKSIKFNENAAYIKEIINLSNSDAVVYKATIGGTYALPTKVPVAGSIAGQVITFAGDTVITSGDKLEIRLANGIFAADDTAQLEVLAGDDSGLIYSVGAGTSYKVTNESRVDLGTYKK